ncbi:sodium/bile acid cotransporter 7-B-like isoform X2 [Agrilus planipennis]|uniref:Sodium/bile acid cotransporter 7-B-like isoform X2 n=1 Tax=Agrilus planipennis TaxID=224129 RepID=A0A1W4WKZ4_AGRPL|nr:sodium/bile acid cotransporter 7-B-like isoform X2 [Agrilus planipennis]
MKSVYLQDYLKRNWLVIGIISCIVLARAFPSIGAKGGSLKPEYSVKYGAVAVIFLISGLSLQTDSIFDTFHQYRLHIFVQCFTFLFIPIYTSLLVSIFENILPVDLWILKGLLIVACMPPPVSSAVILTKAARGNEVAAIFNSVLGSFLGIIITPLLLLLVLNVSTNVPLFSTIFQLSGTVLLPLVIGQFIKKSVAYFKRVHPALSNISQCALLLIIYCTFCDAFVMPDIGLRTVDIFMTVILGIPILRIMFSGFQYAGRIMLPLLVYHPVQIILGGFFVSSLKDWVHSDRRKRRPFV